MNSRIVLFVVALLAGAPTQAQQVRPVPPVAMPGMQNAQGMMAAYAQAQRAANRPGDEKLGCDELQAQFTEVVSDPTIKTHVEATGAAAQRDMATSEASKGQAAAATAASAAANLAPGGQWAALGAAVSQAEVAKAAVPGRMAQRAALAQGSMKALPLFMRAQRLVELGSAQKCEWATGTGVPSARISAEPPTQARP